ncbi:replication initiator [Actinoallomurus acaciae]|uniref:Replication initiator n=1 Tax=Actinoallomurus acaciae TaxID=502577 RepID=A0ABV5YB59_9ACTN
MGPVGGKSIPEAVSNAPVLVLTLTTPSFGAVRTRCERSGRVLPCHARRGASVCPHGPPISYAARYGVDDPRLGEPLCGECYRYAASVAFNATAPEPWHRFTDALRRRLAKLAGLTLSGAARTTSGLLRQGRRVSAKKRRPLPRRIRLDGPGGPATTPPIWATVELLTDAVGHAVGEVSEAMLPLPEICIIALRMRGRTRAGARRRERPGRSPASSSRHETGRRSSRRTSTVASRRDATRPVPVGSPCKTPVTPVRRCSPRSTSIPASPCTS